MKIVFFFIFKPSNTFQFLKIPELRPPEYIKIPFEKKKSYIVVIQNFKMLAS